MNTYIFGILTALAVLVTLLEMLRREKLRERHAVWWLLGGFLALFFAVFPSTLYWASGIIGVAIPVNLVFFICVIVLFLVCVQQSAELTKLDERTRKMAEEILLLQDELQDIDRSQKPSSRKPGSGAKPGGKE